PHLAIGLNTLGAVLLNQGAYAAAKDYFLHAVEMHKTLYPASRYPQGHPDLALSLNNLGHLLHAQGEYAAAKDYFLQALENFEKQRVLFMESAAEAEALNFLVQLPNTRDGLLSASQYLATAPSHEIYSPLWRQKAALSRLLKRRHELVHRLKEKA